MTDIQLYNQISSLPENLKKKVSDFILSLKSKTKDSGMHVKARNFGGVKGLFSDMSHDFDAPLEDFKDYRTNDNYHKR